MVIPPMLSFFQWIPLVFHPFFFVPTKKNGWSPKRKRPPISLCLIPVRIGGWLETRFAQTVEPEFPPALTSIAPLGPARLLMGGELNGILKLVRRRAVSGAVISGIGMRTNPKRKYDTAQGSPRVGEEKVPVVTFSGAKRWPVRASNTAPRACQRS